jgi:GT2 family glycosyltransferase
VPDPLVALLVVHYGDPGLTVRCVESLQRLTYPQRCIIVVHNGKPEPALVDRFPEISHESLVPNNGYAAAVNHGVAAARAAGARYLYALNNDTELEPGAIEPLVVACEADETIGVAGGMHYHADRRDVVQNSGSYLNWFTGRVSTIGEGQHDQGQFAPVAEPDFICGAGFFFRTALFERLGPLDERYFLYCEESDWCFRVQRAGLRIVRVAASKLYHAGGATVSRLPGTYQYFATRNKLWLVRRWAPRRAMMVYIASHVVFRYPKMLIGRLVYGDVRGFHSTLRGIVDGLRMRAS